MAVIISPQKFRESMKLVLKNLKNRNNISITGLELQICDDLGIDEYKWKYWRRGKVPSYDDFFDMASVLNSLGSTRDEVELLLDTIAKSHKSSIVGRLYPPRQREVFKVYKSFESKLKSLIEDDDTSLTRLPIPPYILIRPSKNLYFVGRRDEVRDIQLLIVSRTVIDIVGPPGFGKTSVIKEIIWNLFPGTDDNSSVFFPDGIFYYDFRRNSSSEFFLFEIINAFNPNIFSLDNETDIDFAAQLVLSTKQALIVLDSVEEADSIEKILEYRSKCRVVVISRDKSDAITSDPYIIDRITDDESVSLLRIHGRSYVGADDIALNICAVVGNMPFAVELVGRKLTRSRNGLVMLNELREARVDMLDFSTKTKQSIRRLFDYFVSEFDEYSLSILPLLGTLAYASFDRELVTESLDIEPSMTVIGLERLTEYFWLDSMEVGEYRIHHPLMHEYVQEMELTEDAHLRLHQFYLTGIYLNEETNYGDIIYSNEHLSWWKMYLPHLLKKMYEDKRKEKWEFAFELANGMSCFLRQQGYWGLLHESYEFYSSADKYFPGKKASAYGLSVVAQLFQEQGDWDNALLTHKKVWEQLCVYGDLINVKESKVICLTNIAYVHVRMESHDDTETTLTEALNLARELGDSSLIAIVMGFLAQFHWVQGRFDEALKMCSECLAVFRKMNNTKESVDVLILMTKISYDLSQFENATSFLNQALVLCRNAGDFRCEIRVLFNLCRLHGALEKLDEALGISAEIYRIAQEQDYKSGICLSLHSTSSTYFLQSNIEKAMLTTKEHLKMALEMGDVREQAKAYNNIGFISKFSDDFDEGIEALKKAINIFQKLGIKRNEAEASSNLGQLFRKTGNRNEAWSCYADSISIFESLGDKLGVAETLVNLSNLKWVWGEIEEAVIDAQQALGIFREIQAIEREAHTLHWVFEIFLKGKKYDEAVEYANNAVKTLRKTKDYSRLIWVLGDLTKIYCFKGRWDRAAMTLEECVRLSRQLNDKSKEAEYLKRLGYLYHDRGSLVKAVSYCEQSLKIFQQLEEREHSALLLLDLGEIYRDQRLWEDACRNYELSREIFLELENADRVSDLTSRLIHLHEHHGHRALANGSLNEAVDLFERAIRIDSNIAFASYMLIGVIEYNRGDSEAASTNFNTALAKINDESISKNAYSKFELLELQAVAHLGLNELEKSLLCLEEAIRNSNVSGGTFYPLYELLANSPDPPRGIEVVIALIARSMK